MPPTDAPAIPLDSPRVSLRVKVTAWIVLIFLVIQISLVFVFQLYQGRTITSYFTHRLEARTTAAAGLLAPADGPPDDATLGRAADESESASPFEDFVLALYDGAGSRVASSRNPPPADPPDDLWAAVRAGAGPASGVLPADALPAAARASRGARAVLLRAQDRAGRTFYLYGVMTDDYAQVMLALLSRVLIVSIPIGVVAAAVSAYLIAGIATGPLNAIREMARRLSPESIGERFDVPAGSTETAALRQDLENARQRLEAGFNAQERFMSNVSHELKTPIAVILTEAQTLRLDGSPATVREFVRGAIDELDKLARTVDSFLLLTRVRHGKAATPSDLCLLRDVLVDSYTSCATMAAQHEVRLDLTLPDDDHVDAAVTGNADLLRTICDNLIRSAIRYSPRGGTVWIASSVHGQEVRVCVRDDGPPIPDDILPRIFDRYAQTRDSHRTGRGHGLGLEIAQGIAELHGGRITAANRVTDGGAPAGCEFTVLLPLAPARI